MALIYFVEAGTFSWVSTFSGSFFPEDSLVLAPHPFTENFSFSERSFLNQPLTHMLLPPPLFFPYFTLFPKKLQGFDFKKKKATDMFKKILIANRGEIALRIIRACKDLGIASIALYAPEDRAGLWVEQADEAYELKDLHGRQGYLSIEAILHIAQKSHAEAIHPGYGFLSERPEFAKACHDAGFVFIGPPANAMKKAGDKVEARELAKRANLPTLPGTPPLTSWQEAEARIEEIGLPLLIKAAGGGGGRGMRLVTQKSQVRQAFESACREAEASFGSGKVYFEKYVAKPRHVEIQVMADEHGQAFHLGERECSIQRRYQKLIEESPSPALDEALRQKMGEAALRFVKEIGYINAGTVEFILDERQQFYFLEMNARIQVEHPVTEMVTGLDLVKTQIEVAGGKKLPWRQETIQLKGWAFEARINGEDPLQNFLPSPGKISLLRIPGGPGIRVDTHLYQGCVIPEAFDSLLAKLIVWAPTRQEAAARMRRALSEFRIGGIPTTIPFHMQVFSHPSFLKGDLSTHFIEEHFHRFFNTISEEEAEMAVAALALEARPSSSFLKKTKEENLWGKTARLENTRNCR
jgi:acetyl-CoA carboxylase biotin carboxylase subunit